VVGASLGLLTTPPASRTVALGFLYAVKRRAKGDSGAITVSVLGLEKALS